MRRIEKNTLGEDGVHRGRRGRGRADAINKLALGGFELVLMDWNMPNMTGIEALKLIKANPNTKAVPVIMVTSESEKTRIMEAIQSGAANYVVKPFQPETLQEKISAVTKK